MVSESGTGLDRLVRLQTFFFETFTAVAFTSMELRLRKDRPVTVRQVDQGKDLDMTTGRAEFKTVAIYGC